MFLLTQGVSKKINEIQIQYFTNKKKQNKNI